MPNRAPSSSEEEPWLPRDYKEPAKPSKYLKFKDEETTFRIVSRRIEGYVWFVDKKPVRARTKDEVPSEYVDPPNKMDRAKYFWAFVVWNPDTEKIQVCEITQASIREGIVKLVNNKRWGNPRTYDICVGRTGEGIETEYSVIPGGRDPIPDAMLKLAANVNLEALYSGGDPFEGADDKEGDYGSGLGDEEDDAGAALGLITGAQHKRLKAIVTDAGIGDDVYRTILSMYGYKSGKDIKIGDYEKICKDLEEAKK